ncbi:MAG: DUF5752 family protein [Syntrophobacter sp.]
MPEPFAVKDCALIAIGTGERAQNLRELRDHLLTTHPGCIHYHFWGGLLRPRFDDPEYQNDFAAWAWRGLHDANLAERLAIIDPAEFNEIEALRREVIEVIEERLEETEMVPWAKQGHHFYFVRSQIVVFDTKVRLESLDMLHDYFHRMSVGSIFYHYIDARRRSAGKRDDFSEWLSGFGDTYAGLVQCLSNVDPYFSTLTELREEIDLAFVNCRTKGGL